VGLLETVLGHLVQIGYGIDTQVNAKSWREGLWRRGRVCMVYIICYGRVAYNTRLV
jgi:hypothetical protein